ncbi:PREDICTED: senescence-associated carboxylesterase 101-like [Prunus mume]|uniref:Senescence-associated carboxylesterase 101-like n=1 Tax=Prunus mume TaxID=102107 RepID=A0ABM1LPF4_PRUMU|nr:PREDICTED: senescence-associated carboxylesterase 101-like [Prunus mume]
MSNLFSSGLELANVLLTSEPLHQSWIAIQNDKQKVNPNAQPTLHINTTRQADLTIITFLTSPMSLRGQEGLILSSTFKERDLSDFKFLCESFFINEAAIKLFASRFDELRLLKTEISRSNSLVIITGYSMGGCVATLFTLWLLESLNLLKANRPLCITFGSPLIGDENLRKCVSQFPAWTSCFLHVASIQDPVPKLFLSPNPTALGTGTKVGSYKPFGTFLLCSDSGCACFEDPDLILELVAANSQGDQTQYPNVGIQFFDYGQLLERLKLKAFCKDVFELAESDRVPLKASIITQLAAIFGVPQSQALQQQQPNINILKKMMETHEYKLAIQKTKISNAAKKLNDMKVNMVYLEWYKKDSKGREIGYYDMYKNKRNRSDFNVQEFKKKLSNYWQDAVEEVENKPQKEGAAFRTRWLMGGTTYRRMMEPLHIAEYYKDNDGKNYIEKRPGHFILLEKWLKDEEKGKVAERIRRGETVEDGPSKSKAQNVASSLTDDSCFWAHVEEALILCNQLEKGQPSFQEKEQCKQKLREFEEYVLDSLKNFAVTPDIFLKYSSFMAWWKQYNKIVGSSTQLAHIMTDGTYRDYEKGVKVVS